MKTQRHKILCRHICQHQAWISFKPKALVILRLAQNHTAMCRQGLQLCQCGCYQAAAYAQALHFRQNRYRPQPNQCAAPLLMLTGDTATWPTIRPASVATSDTVNALAARKAPTIKCSVCDVCGAVKKAACVKASISVVSLACSALMFMVTFCDKP